MSRAGLLGVLLAVVAVTGCDKKSLGMGGNDAKLKASDAKWKDTELTIGDASAKFFMTGSGDGDPSFMDAYFDKFPKSTEIDVGGTKGTTSEQGHLALKADMKGKLGPLELRTLSTGQVDLDVKIVIKAPGSETIEQKLPPMRIGGAVSTALARARDGGLKFEGEKDDGKITSAAIVDARGTFGELKVVGDAKKVWDIDWVAVMEQKESSRTKACSGYQKVTGDVIVTQVDSVVKIVDRRTGKVAQEQTFQPKDECPSFAMVEKNNTAKAYVHDSDVEPWVREQLDKVK